MVTLNEMRGAGWHVKADSKAEKKATYGYSVHTGVDEAGFVHRQSMISGNVHDSQERDTLLLGDESALYTDPAYEVGEDDPKSLLEGKSAQLIINTGNSSEVLE